MIRVKFQISRILDTLYTLDTLDTFVIIHEKNLFTPEFYSPFWRIVQGPSAAVHDEHCSQT